MRYVVKFLGLIGLGLGVIYTFYINGNVSSYGFWAWTLSVIVSLLTLCNVASLIAALNYSSYNEDKVDDEKGMLVLSSFLGFLIYCGILFFSGEFTLILSPIFLFNSSFKKIFSSDI